MATAPKSADSENGVSRELSDAWDAYYATLGELRQNLDASMQFRMAPDQIGMGYRQLIEVQAMAYNFAVGPRTAHPRMFHNTTWQTEFYSIGGNGPDFDYHLTFLDARHDYVLRGQMNDTRTLICQLNNKLPGSPGSRCIANFEFSQFADADGHFEILVSARPHDGHHIALEAGEDYQWLMFRPTVQTWDAKPAAMTIERISPLGDDESEIEEYNQERIAKRIRQATGFMRFVFTDWVLGYAPLTLKGAGEVNKFFVFSSADGGEMGSPAAQYLQCVFEVEDDEALILEFDSEPDGPYWSLQLYDVYQHGLAMRTGQTTLHSRQMAKEPDGSVRIVLSRQDPGYVNWLDNSGYSRGEVTWRNYLATRNVGHRIHRVKFADLAANLPAGFARITPEERQAELARRKAAYLMRHGE